jgi:hypothetical protein
MLNWDEQSDVIDNRTFFRTVNRKLLLEGVWQGSALRDPRFFCECGSRACTARLDLGGAELERLREGGTRVVAAGHEEKADRVLLRTRSYVVVSDARR